MSCVIFPWFFATVPRQKYVGWASLESWGPSNDWFWHVHRRPWYQGKTSTKLTSNGGKINCRRKCLHVFASSDFKEITKLVWKKKIAATMQCWQKLFLRPFVPRSNGQTQTGSLRRNPSEVRRGLQIPRRKEFQGKQAKNKLPSCILYQQPAS